MKIDLKEVREFFEKEEISRIACEHFNGRHDGFNDIFNLLLTAFEIEKENKTDSVKELRKIENNINYLNSLMGYGNMDSLKFIEKNHHNYQSIQNTIDFVLDYKGIWNIEYFLEHHRLSKEEIIKLREEVESEFYPSENEIKEKNLKYKVKKEKEREVFLEKYYEKKIMYTISDINKYLSENSFISAVKVNEDLIEYPILIKILKNGELLGIKKEFSNIKNKLKVLSKTFDFDDYSIVHIPRNKIDDLQIEAFIKYKVKYLPTTIASSNCGNYKSFQQLKKRFSEDFDIRKKKKIIDLFNVPNYRFNNGLEIVHRDLFDEALKKFYDEKN